MERQYIWQRDFVFYTKMKNFRDKVCINSQLKQPHFLFCSKITLDHWFLVYNIWLLINEHREKEMFDICNLFGAFFSWYKVSLLLRYCCIDSQSLYSIAVNLESFKFHSPCDSCFCFTYIDWFIYLLLFLGSLWIFFNICGIISLCIFWLMAFSTTCCVLKHL